MFNALQKAGALQRQVVQPLVCKRLTWNNAGCSVGAAPSPRTVRWSITPIRGEGSAPTKFYSSGWPCTH